MIARALVVAALSGLAGALAIHHPVHHGDGVGCPVGVALQQQLQGEGGDLNAGRPVHDTAPCGSSPARGACP